VRRNARVTDTEQILASVWKATFWSGLLGIVIGVTLLAWPKIGLSTLIAVIGAFALVAGSATLIGAMSVPIPAVGRTWLIVEGLVGVTVGVLVFAWPDLSALALLYAIAAWAVGLGVFEFGAALALSLSGERALLLALEALFSITFGLIMFAHPGAGAVALLALIAAFAVVTGVMRIAYALELRRVAADVHRFTRSVSERPPAHV
jgi:uncharacterized membrane protein HdeD (DUF308 family)